MGRFFLNAVAALLALQAVEVGGAEEPRTTVVGRVRDAENAEPIPGAVVSLPDVDRTVITDAEGRYVLRQVEPGPQHISVRIIGYAQRSLHALVPREGELEINISLRPDPIRIPTVEVQAPVIVRGFDSGDTDFPDRELSGAAVRNHPLLAEPDFFQALSGGEVVLSPESPSGVHIRGGASDHTAYLLDGIPVFNPFHTAGVSSAWNPDALSRLHLSSSLVSLAPSHALSGTIEGVTREPGANFRGQGTVSTAQARLTVDGPLGMAGLGYVVSLRSGLPDLIAHNETSYIRGATADFLAKVEAPAFGGRIQLLGYESDNDINTAAFAEGESLSNQDGRRNVFEWDSRSLGAEWERVSGSTTVRLRGWRATSDANSNWTARAAHVEMAADRGDQGLLVAVERRLVGATTAAEIRVEQCKTSYSIVSDSSAALPNLEISARTPIATALVQHGRTIGRRLELKMGASLAVTGGDWHAGPGAELRWKLSEQATLSASYTRAHQFAQSLRNAESVVGNVFPVDLYMGSGAQGVPVARSDQGVIAARYSPWAGVRVGAQAYARAAHGLLLVAPAESEPFTTGAFASGSGASRGVSVDAAVSAARYGIVASYGLQRLRFEYGESSYVPDHGANHFLEGGVTVFPTATFSVNIGAASILGRRTTTVSSGLEWEACNLFDQGCEFGGSPHYDGEALGGTALPPYFRVDLGARKHWHIGIGGRDSAIGLFGTVTNILGRKNLLTYARDPSTGERVGIEMRPPSPLVLGVDWRF